MIDTKKITQLLEISSLDDLRIDISKKLNISEDNNEAANREFSRENEVYYNVESEEIVPIEIQFQPTDYNFCA
jgi:hypothetical protein